MKKIVLFIGLCCLVSCTNYGQLEVTAHLPKKLEEVSGIQYSEKEQAFWMLNDSGNKPHVFLVSEKGKILRKLKIAAKNIDWEDITKDDEGNIYVGDFGNNGNHRKDLTILKVNSSDLTSGKKIEVTKIQYYYPEQKKFPPKKKKMYYDTEAFFAWNGYFYIFTKSRVKGEIGRTFLYRVPNQSGNHEATRISEFTTCPKQGCWITGADITKDGKKVVLLNHTSAWVFTNFKGDDFFSGNSKKYSFGHDSQKESITFKNTSTIYVTDEENRHGGRNLYKFSLSK
ncbi:hypothetical protein RQM59_01025 [Flavobacteriaceae bacterium S356]|uniref:Uncharacterized protein n=1 Tax=Asprobacillus argus TaxID=3076534 RepID=A0ABU3LB21_9FLAO|nr:hypothetical protein [Flavobacteriaceae bacterium S356]